MKTMGVLNTFSCSKTSPRKCSFESKLCRKDGLFLNIHHTTEGKAKSQTLRFISADFSASGNMLAAVNHLGDIFIIEFSLNKYWFLMNIPSSCLLRFWKEKHVLVALASGGLVLVDVATSKSEELNGHKWSVLHLAFSEKNCCISSSTVEAILWDLKARKQIQVLKLQDNESLKFAAFVPSSGLILTCFQNDILEFWCDKSFKPVKRIFPSSKLPIKTVAFTRDGRAMVIGGGASFLALLLLEIWTITETIKLPENLHAVKHLEFLCHPFDGGANKILAMLASNGTVHFLNMEHAKVIGKLQLQKEISRFRLCPQGKRIVCAMKSGELNVYDVAKVLVLDGKKVDEKPVELVQKPVAGRADSGKVRQEICDILDMNKLKGVLRKFGAYPDVYRRIIWASNLHLSNNQKRYDDVVKNPRVSPFNELEKSYPIENKQDLKNLKRLLGNVVSWCPSLAAVTYLPIFAFPFVRVFQNEPVLCFEAVVTILVNFCQYWFQYHPMPPLNILGIIENILLEQDPELLLHLQTNDIKSNAYAWPLLQSTLSEVLTAPDWLVLWDHVVSNEPAFLLLVVAAYSLINRHVLLAFDTTEQFVRFFSQQNLIDFKRLIAKSYKLLETVSDKNHPKRYLDKFRKLVEVTPEAISFPEELKEYDVGFEELREKFSLLRKSEQEVLLQDDEEILRLIQAEKENEELLRHAKLKEQLHKRLQHQRAEIDRRTERLSTLAPLNGSSEERLDTAKIDEMMEKFHKMVLPNTNGAAGDTNQIVEKVLLEQYINLQKHNLLIKQLMCERIDCEKLEKLHREVNEKFEESKRINNCREFLTQLVVDAGLDTMNTLINKVDVKLRKEGRVKTTKVDQIATEAKLLFVDINNLLDILKNLN